jgi:phenylpropionate dioxygenase-like ring-hydroxylating dioxygenase large terminal subunit
MARTLDRSEAPETTPIEREPWVPARVVYTGGPPESDPRRLIPSLGFRDYWYPLVGAASVSRRKPRMIRMLGDELCVFHGAHGVAAVTNFCPHRGTRLAGGNCHYAGTVTCPYHGFTYDERGECVAALPEGPESRMPGKIRARRYPTRTLKGIVFVWMGDGEPTPVEQDLPPELFDKSMVLHDTIRWNANWRPALENFQDAHAPYVHRDSIAWVVRPIVKRSFAGARPVIYGGGVPLTYYRDSQRDGAPYQEYFPGVQGYWPKHRWRLLWTPLFGDMRRPHYGGRSQAYFEDAEWANGPHMPGMQRIDFGGAMYTRWCVPIDRETTREFYFLATRPASRWERFRQWASYPVVFRWWQYRNFGLQDDRVLSDTAFDRPEYFSEYDVETIGWRTLAILTAAYGGRHDRIPAEVIEKFNNRALASLHATGRGQ